MYKELKRGLIPFFYFINYYLEKQPPFQITMVLRFTYTFVNQNNTMCLRYAIKIKIIKIYNYCPDPPAKLKSASKSKSFNSYSASETVTTVGSVPPYAVKNGDDPP